MNGAKLIERIFGDRHMGGDLPFDFTALVTRAIVCVSRKVYHNARGYGAYALAPKGLDFDASVDFIARSIRAGKPFMAGKIGTGDGEALQRFMDKHAKEPRVLKVIKMLLGLRGPFWWDNSIRGGICVCAGVFPIRDAAIEEFCRIFASHCRAFDGFSRCTYGEGRLYAAFCPQATPIVMDALVPLATPHTWYAALKGKRVLVVHQYVRTIRAQYEKHVEFHRGQGPLPDFELVQYRPVNSAGGTCRDFKTWPEALAKMKSDISKLDFDVAVLGCGVYGVPLSAHIKQMGRVAIYTGGATQAIFGIKGRRWDNAGIYNEHWVRPFPDDIPENMAVIESGSFI